LIERASVLVHPQFDPVALALGPLHVHWYGLMYLAGFAAGWWLGVVRAARPGSGWRPAEIIDLLTWVALGVVLGGRLGYMLFYQGAAWLENPLAVFQVWNGGMSFHGGLLGVIIAVWWYGRQSGRGLLEMGDFIAPLIPPGLFFGRLGNFINGELWGRPTDLPWGMVFPQVDTLARHPSQLYEAVMEGLVLFAVVWWFSSRPRRRGRVAALFLMGYAVFRSLCELAREPDRHLGFIAGDFVTMGMLLSLPMFLLGAWLWWRAGRPDTPLAPR